MPNPKLECRGLEQHEKAAYLKFAEEAWGRGSPQANPSYLDWLYANPNTLGMGQDLIVLVEGNRVVGSDHRMRVPWRVKGRRLIVPSLHDLYVLPSHRGAGSSLVPPGLQIILKSLEREPHVAMFGSTPEADAVYNGMRIPGLQLFWLEKNRSRLAAGLQMTASRVGWRFRNHRKRGSTQSTWRNHQVLRVDFPTADELLEALSLKPDAPNYPDWDLESFKWRFFHELGPQNILLLARRGGRVVARSVVSVGLRHGCIVARFLELLFENGEALEVLLQESENLFSEVRAAVCLATTSSPEVVKRLLASGWQQRRQTLGSHWFSRSKQEKPEDLWISGGAWDYGCDARLGN